MDWAGAGAGRVAERLRRAAAGARWAGVLARRGGGSSGGGEAAEGVARLGVEEGVAELDTVEETVRVPDTVLDLVADGEGDPEDDPLASAVAERDGRAVVRGRRF